MEFVKNLKVPDDVNKLTILEEDSYGASDTVSSMYLSKSLLFIHTYFSSILSIYVFIIFSRNEKYENKFNVYPCLNNELFVHNVNQRTVIF